MPSEPTSSSDTAAVAERNADAERRLRDLHRLRAAAEPDVVVRAPGRVNLIGEHTDYLGGLCLPAAIGLYVFAAASRRSDGHWRFHTADEGADLLLDRAAGVPPEELTCPRWAVYPLTMAQALSEAAPFGTGFDLTFAASLPAGQGLASSAAIEVATGLALGELMGRPVADRLRLALDACEVEKRASTVQCGIMDQVAVALGRAGHALLLDCRDVTVKPVPLPLEPFALVICQSGKTRALAHVGYNERRREANAALDALGTVVGFPFAPRALTMEVLQAAAGHLTPKHRRRLTHVVSENERVVECAKALERGDAARVRALFLASHRSLRFEYEVSTPELDHLVDLALEVHPLVAARLTGAGFGGATVNLVPREAVSTFVREVPRRFGSRFKPDATALVVPVVDGAERLA